MSELSEFERRAFETRDAGAVRPIVAAKMAIEQLQREDVKFKHAIVVMVQEGQEDSDIIHVLQAGDLSCLGSEGALARALRVVQDQ